MVDQFYNEFKPTKAKRSHCLAIYFLKLNNIPVFCSKHSKNISHESHTKRKHN